MLSDSLNKTVPIFNFKTFYTEGKLRTFPLMVSCLPTVKGSAQSDGGLSTAGCSIKTTMFVLPDKNCLNACTLVTCRSSQVQLHALGCASSKKHED